MPKGWRKVSDTPYMRDGVKYTLMQNDTTGVVMAWNPNYGFLRVVYNFVKKNLDLGCVLKWNRIQHGWTMQQLAEILSVYGFQTIYQWEKNLRRPDQTMRGKLEKLYDINLGAYYAK